MDMEKGNLYKYTLKETGVSHVFRLDESCDCPYLVCGGIRCWLTRGVLPEKFETAEGTLEFQGQVHVRERTELLVRDNHYAYQTEFQDIVVCYADYDAKDHAWVLVHLNDLCFHRGGKDRTVPTSWSRSVYGKAVFIGQVY